MAEVVKHGLIANPALLDTELWSREQAEILVRQAVQVKIDIVEVDPYERGIRAHLNLGHTFGHAIEKATDYAIPHGEAVAIGTVKAARLSRNLGLIDDGLVERILKIMWRLQLPTDIALDPERWYAANGDRQKMESWSLAAGRSHGTGRGDRSRRAFEARNLRRALSGVQLSNEQTHIAIAWTKPESLGDAPAGGLWRHDLGRHQRGSRRPPRAIQGRGCGRRNRIMRAN